MSMHRGSQWPPNAPLGFLILFLFFYAKERRLQNQEKKFWVVRELLLFEAIKRNGTFPQPTEVITLSFISGKSTFNLVKI